MTPIPVQRKNKYAPLNVAVEHIDYIKEAYLVQKKSIAGIGKELGISSGAVSQIMDKNNIPKRSDRDQALRFTCDETFFDVIDTEEKAYWLGFIYADGYIVGKNAGVGITLWDVDKHHLEKFKRAINYNGNIKTYPPSKTSYSSNSYCKIIISSQRLAEALVSKGCYAKKTDILLYPTTAQVPLYLQNHFIRGYIDGDGSLRMSLPPNRAPQISISITGTKEMMLGIQDYFQCSHLKLYKRKDNGTNNYTSTIGGNKKATKILNTLYKGASICLDRKYQKYMEIIEEYRKFTSRAEQ